MVARLELGTTTDSRRLRTTFTFELQSIPERGLPWALVDGCTIPPDTVMRPDLCSGGRDKHSVPGLQTNQLPETGPRKTTRIGFASRLLAAAAVTIR